MMVYERTNVAEAENPFILIYKWHKNIQLQELTKNGNCFGAIGLNRPGFINLFILRFVSR